MDASALRRLALKLPRGQASFRQVMLVALSCVGGATLLRFALDPLVGTAVPFISFFPLVLVASLLAGSAAGLITLASSLIIVAYVWLPNTYSFDLTRASWFALLSFGFFGGMMIVIAALIRSLVAALIVFEERAVLVAHEMKHRVGNVLGVVQAISRQTARNAATLEEHQAVFQGRLSALGRAQDVIADNPDRPADLGILLGHVLEPFGLDRFTMSGAPQAVPNDLGSSLSLLLHELGTNAVKYGALSTPVGRVAIGWSRRRDRIALEWRELGGPAVVPPRRSGFGSRLMKTAFPPDLGTTDVAYEPDGLRCTISFQAPASPAAERRSAPAAAMKSA